MKITKRLLSIALAVAILVSALSVAAEGASVSLAKLNLGYMAPTNSKGTKTVEKVKLYGDYDYINFYIKSKKKDSYFFYEIYSDKACTKLVEGDAVHYDKGEYSFVKKIKLKKKYKSKTYYMVTYAGITYSDGSVKIDKKSVREFKVVVKRDADFDDKVVVLKETKNTTDGVYIKWGKLSGASKYYIYRRSITGTKWKKVGSASSKKTSFTDTSVKSKNGNYIYSVRAVNKKGTKSRYLYSGLTCLFAKAPTMKSITVTYNNTIEIKWKSTSSKAKYNIMRKEGEGSWKTIKKNYSGTSYKDTTAKNGKKYTYTVKAVISTDYGKATSAYYSNSSKAVTYLKAPSLKEVVAVENGISISWKAVSGAKSYTIYRKNSDGSTDWSAVGNVKSGVTSFIDTSADLETAYIYTVRSEASKNKGSYNGAGIEYIYDDPEKSDERIVAYYTVVDGKVVNLVNGKEMENATVDNDGYFRGGKVVLPSSYEKATIEAIMVYNRASTDLPVGNGLSYYGGAFLFQEVVDLNNLGMIKTPFGGGWIGTNFTLRPSLNYNKRVMSDGESYWCLAFNKDESTHAMQINDDYVEKSHWSNYINSTFTLSSEHQFKEFIVYSEKLTKAEMADHFAESGISLSADTDTVIGRVNDGIIGLGSAFAFTKTGQYGIPEWYNTNTEAGDYSVEDGNGTVLNYTISDYIEPDLEIDHSKYESVHIIKKPERLPMGYKYALSAVPYPFNVNHNGNSDQYDVSWSSSDESVALVIDGLVVPQKEGTVTITATLRGTGITDSCTIKIVNEKTAEDIAVRISADYVSENGNSFSESDYVMTTNAIYDAISEAYRDGYNHIIFPEINFYAAPTETEYYIPSGMTVEFPEGSVFRMMPGELAKTEGYTYFRMGWGWWSCDIPTEKASVEKDENGNILAYYCRDSHLIIDKYYGEFYDKNATMKELYEGANEYQWGCTLLSIGKRAEYCSVEIREANCPAGLFITMGGKGNSELVNGEQGSIAANEFVSGWLNDNGELEENPNWISTNDFYLVSKAANGMDTLHEYYIGDWEHNVVAATQHLYDILWYDEDYNLIGANRWQYIDEGYANKPQNAVYFKLSVQQSELPAGTDEYVRIGPDESSRFCEIKNTNIINGADGLASVVGSTEACWIHDNYVSGDGLLDDSCWSLVLEDGWAGMRGTIIERNIFRKYTYANIGEYRGADSGVLNLASGYNTFVISNYLGAVAQSKSNVANTHIINNVVHSLYSSFSSGKPNDIRPKINSHIYYNVLGQISNEISSNGVNYYRKNKIIPTVNLW